jgi:hypothetical protein
VSDLTHTLDEARYVLDRARAGVLFALWAVIMRCIRLH